MALTDDDLKRLLPIIRRMQREERSTPRARLGQALFRPATVQAASFADVVVLLDGDGAGETVTAVNVTGHLLNTNQRVMVLLDAPHGAFIVGLLANAAWISWTPTVSSNTGTITTVGALNCQYMRIGRLIVFQASITITTNGTGATAVQFSLPVNLTSTAVAIGSGRESALTGKMLNVVASPVVTTGWILYYDNSYPGADNALFRIVGSYQAAS